MSRSKLSRRRANGRCGSRGLAITGGGRQGGSTQVRSRGLRCLHTRLTIVLSGRAGPYTSIGSGLLLLLLLLFLLHLLLQLRLLLPKLRLLLQCHEKLLGLDELWIVGRSVVRFQLLKSLHIVCQQRLSSNSAPGWPNVMDKLTSYMSLICCCVKLAGRLAPGKCCPGAAAGCTEAMVPGQRGSVSKD